MEVKLHLFLTSTLDTCEWPTSRSRCFISEKEHRFPLDRRLGGPQRGSGRFEDRKVFAPSRIQTRDFPGRSLVAIMTTLYQRLLIKTTVVQSEAPTALIPLHASAHVQRQFQTPHFLQISVLTIYLRVILLHLDV